MRKSYLFVYNDAVGTREQIIKILDQMITVFTWRYDMPNCFYVISEYSADSMASEFERIRGGLGRFVFLEYTGNSQGRITAESWHLLNKGFHQGD